MHVHSSTGGPAFTCLPTSSRTHVHGHDASRPDGAARTTRRSLACAFPLPPGVALGSFIFRVGTFSLGVQPHGPGGTAWLGKLGTGSVQGAQGGRSPSQTQAGAVGLAAASLFACAGF